jgi:hypothetical protein
MPPGVESIVYRLLMNSIEAIEGRQTCPHMEADVQWDGALQIQPALRGNTLKRSSIFGFQRRRYVELT